MINFLFCTVLSPGASKVDQTHKFNDFLDLTQFFQLWPDSVLIEINDVRNDVINILNFIINPLGLTVFTTRASEGGKFPAFCRKNRFLVDFRGQMLCYIKLL